MITHDAGAKAHLLRYHVLKQASIRAQLGFRGSPPRRSGEKHPRASDVFYYDHKYVEAITSGFSLADALDYAKETAR